MPVPVPLPPATALVWPAISDHEYMMMWAVPIVLSLAIWIWLSCLWTENIDKFEKENRCCCPGEVTHSGKTRIQGRQYAADWKTTFDLVFLIFMLVLGGALLGLTVLYEPELFGKMQFWTGNLIKLGIMCGVSLIGGLMCRYFLGGTYYDVEGKEFRKIDEQGYTKTAKSDGFKVNYTRKFQHFSAYAIPLLMKTGIKGGNPVLHLVWGDFFTLIGFLVLIKPLRENFYPFMLMFNSLDRPEDRPHCLKWIIAGNILPGLAMIIFFDWVFLRFGLEQQKLVMIFVLVAGVGDGLAEPVGIYFGKHKYRTRSCGTPNVYLRSFEGSTCVFITTFIWIIMYYASFENSLQFWLCMLILPLASTLAEATSPHTMDTPFLMGLGGATMYVLLRWF